MFLLHTVQDLGGSELHLQTSTQHYWVAPPSHRDVKVPCNRGLSGFPCFGITEWAQKTTSASSNGTDKDAKFRKGEGRTIYTGTAVGTLSPGASVICMWFLFRVQRLRVWAAILTARVEISLALPVTSSMAWDITSLVLVFLYVKWA